MSITTLLYGGMGNQMFQFSIGHFIASRTGKKLTIDNKFFDDVNCDREYDLDVFENFCALNIEKNIDRTNATVVHDPGNITKNWIGNVTAAANKTDIVLDGHFQQGAHVTRDLLEIFFQPAYKTEAAKNFAEQITDNDLMLNVRRTDYVTSKQFPFLEKPYHDRAFEKFDQYDNVYVFSDEPEWCRQNLHQSFIVVGHEYAGPKFYDYLKMMKRFKKMIIPNSTFAWWAAVEATVLDSTVEVVCPNWDLWYDINAQRAKNLMLDQWTKIERCVL